VREREERERRGREKRGRRGIVRERESESARD
jgi:hypothetical protein